MQLGTLEEIKDLRTVWPNEAADFTPWLAQDENIAILGDALGIDITVDETESPVGDFSADICATETGTDRKIVIENQLEDTDHDHLGKLITYASGKEADIIIWVVKRAREEHRAAIEWLNNQTDEKIGFFLCETKLYRIGDSDPAVKFEIVERPNGWTKEIRKAGTASKTEQIRYEYWTAFLRYASQNERFTSEFRIPTPSFDHALGLGGGFSSCSLIAVQARRRSSLAAELYISRKKELFHMLADNKEAIEKESGLHFEWKELPDKKASRIVIEKDVSFSDTDQWPEQFDWLMDVLIRMKNAFSPYL